MANPVTAIRLQHSAKRRVLPTCVSRLLFLIGALIVYRIGTFIPVPGIDPAALARFLRRSGGHHPRRLQHVLGRRAARAVSIFAMSVMPYISASIIVQMMTVVVPLLAPLRKEGESGRRKITQYTRYGTVGLALFQCFGAAGGAAERQAWCSIPGSQFLFTATRDHDHRHHVPDVARRADHRARHRQRHLDDHPGRHRGRAAGRDRQHAASRCNQAR